MKKTHPILSAILFMVLSTSSYAQWQNKGFTHQGNARQYRVYKSPNYNASNPASMVLTLHGLGDNMTNFSGIGMNNVADTANIIVVVPQAMTDAFAGTAWNSGAGYSGYYPNSTIDDVAFMSALIDTIKTNYAINPNRVYACGFSMGGFMTNRLAVALNNKITAFASVSGTFGDGLPSYVPNKKLSIAHFHGTTDGTVPYAGNASGIGADSLVKFWFSNDVCNTTPIHTSLPDIQSDGYTIDHYKYIAGQNGTEVEFFKVTGADHVWLTAANDISYTVEIWKFFNKHKTLITGIEESISEVNINLYPNPTNDVIHLNLNENSTDKNHTLTIIDLTGNVILSEEINKDQYSVSLKELGITNGIYLMKLQGKNINMSKKIMLME